MIACNFQIGWISRWIVVGEDGLFAGRLKLMQLIGQKGQLGTTHNLYIYSYHIISIIQNMQTILLLLLITVTFAYNNCDQSSPIYGCLSCLDPTYDPILNISQQLYTCYTSDVQCVLVQGELCVECSDSYVVDNVTQQCAYSEGCGSMEDGACLQCVSESYYLVDGVCVGRTSVYCLNYASDGNCSECAYEFLSPSTDCGVDSSLCVEFEFQTWTCMQCPDNTILHPSALFCVAEVSGCLSYDTSGCVLCQQGYIIDSGACTFVEGTIQTTSQQIICINRNTEYDTTVHKCQPISEHCLQQLNSLCIQCHQLYYLLSSTCQECTLPHCLTCTSDTNCTSCIRGYYSLHGECVECEIFGCKLCEGQDDSVYCTQCHTGLTLSGGNCFQCPIAQTYSAQLKKCISCTISNCQHCSLIYASAGTVEECTWCTDGYYVDGNACVEITNFTVPTLSTSSEILQKISPNIYPQYNTQQQLIKNCNHTNGYICFCSSKDLSSKCEQFVYDVDFSDLYAPTCEEFQLNSDAYRMMAQLPAFNTTFNPFDCQLPVEEYEDLLTVYSMVEIRGGTSMLTNLPTQLETMKNVFSEQTPTILRGNGFYYKYVPEGVTDNDAEVSTTITDSWSLIFITYDRVEQTSALTGHIYVWSNSTSSFNLSIQKLGEILNTNSFNSKIQGIRNSSVDVSLNGTTLTIQNFLLSDSTLQGYQIFSRTTTSDLYLEQRIQYIFYNESFIYILGFLTLYLVLLPVCSIVDCCDNKEAHNRKRRVNTSEEENREQNTINVNYRDFFPMYNIANSPRKTRLYKLCLYLLNCQHGVTILTVSYYTLPADQEIIAILIGIACYFATIVMGYLCGFMVVCLPSYFKYLINIITFGYWVLWIILMRQFTSSEYKLYVLVFMFLFLCVDLLLDALQTLLMYFTIKQEEKQTGFFMCLAGWLSKRGFYEFDQLARQMREEQ